MPGPITPGPSTVGTYVPPIPVWTYTTGAMADGKLTTDAATMGMTNTFSVSPFPKAGGTDALANYFVSATPNPSSVRLALTSLTSGKTSMFTVGDATDLGVQYTFNVSFNSGDSGTWSGDYSVAIIPQYPPLKTDTGWTANASGGDKTVSVADYTAPDFTGLDTVDKTVLDALAAQLIAVTKKLQALETAAANSLRPNA